MGLIPFSSFSALDRMVKEQQKKLAKLTAPEWRKMGADLVLKMVALTEPDAK